jgi:hypothetical protein
MTKDETIELARQAGIHYRELSDEFATGNGDGVEIEQMQAFAKLVAEKEREACAKVADHWVGLTDEERKEIWWSCEQQTPTTFVKAIEQALKEKNV